MINILNKQNHRLKDENSRLNIKLNSINAQNQKIRNHLINMQNEKKELIKQRNILLNENEILKESIENYNNSNYVESNDNNSNNINNEEEEEDNYNNYNNNVQNNSFYERQITNITIEKRNRLNEKRKI